MAWWDEWLPIRSPLEGLFDDDPREIREHLPVNTRRGRVVYERKRRPFTSADVLRVWRRANSRGTESVGTLTSALITFNLQVIAWMVKNFPKQEFLVWRWIGDYLKGILDGVRQLLSDAGWKMDEISLVSGGEASSEEGIPV
jgi:hypothetical protein